MTYEMVTNIAEEREHVWQHAGFGLAREVLRCWDLLETQANQLYKLRDRRS